MVVVSCGREDNIELKPDSGQQIQIEQAKQWFEERMYSENYLTAESGMQLYKDWVPDWENATVHQLTKSKTVEVPMLFKKIAGSVSSEVFAEYLRTQDAVFLQSYATLIIETNLSSGAKRDFIMKLSPSLKYLKKMGELKNSSYQNVSDDFDGYILYCDLNWEFVSGIKYSDGNIVGRLSKTRNTEEEELTRGLQMLDRDCLYNFISDADYEWDPEYGWILGAVGVGYFVDCLTLTYYGEEGSNYDNSYSYPCNFGEEYYYDQGAGSSSNSQTQQYNQAVQNKANSLKNAVSSARIHTFETIPNISVNINNQTSKLGSVYYSSSCISFTDQLYNKYMMVGIDIPANLTDIQQKLVMAHEVMHLILLDISRIAGSKEQLSIINNSLMQSIYKYMDVERGHHEYMGEHIYDMENLLRKAFPNESNDFYRYGKWGGGAFDSDVFNALPEAEQKAVFRYLSENNLY